MKEILENLTDPQDWVDAEIVGPEETVEPVVLSPEVEARKIMAEFNSVSDEARMKFMEWLVKHTNDNLRLIQYKYKNGIL